MKKNYSILITFLSPVILVLFFAGTLYHSGSPGGRTGSPGDNGNNCTTCHSGTPNNVNSWITSDVPELGYIVGDTYNITATGTHIGVGRFGFELTAEDESGNKVGQFIVSGDGQTQLVNNGKSVTHTSSGITPNGSTKTWTFQWIAPATDVGNITFYAAFNAANNNGGTSGDIIYLSSMTISESSIGIHENNDNLEFSLFPNPSYGDINVNHQLTDAQIQISDINGKLVYNQMTNEKNNKINLRHLDAGVYFVQLVNGNDKYTKKLIIK